MAYTNYVLTQGVSDLIFDRTLNTDNLKSTIERFEANDWGTVSEADKVYQNDLLKDPKAEYLYRFMGIFILNNIKLWMFKEYDDLNDEFILTVLLPEEY